MSKYYPIAKPHISSKEISAITEVLRSGNLSLGPKHLLFEQKFAEKIGTKFACSVSSGTAGLHLAMIAAGIKAGNEVITSPLSFVASANCILYVGAKPVFVDINPLTYNINPDKIETAITPKTKAILAVHIFGQTAEMTAIQKIAKKHRLKIIEDACESIGATHYEKKAGTFGESAIFAFYPNKQMTTGEGGMLVTNNEKIYRLGCSLRNQGRSENMQWLDHERLGYNYRMDEMSAAVGLVQLEKLDWMIKERSKVANLYHKNLDKHQDLLQIPYLAKGNTHTWFVYVVKLKNKKAQKKRDRVIISLAKQSISTKPYLPPIHLFKFYKKSFGYKKGDFPIAEEVGASTIALPFYIGLKETDVIYITKKLIDTVKNI